MIQGTKNQILREARETLKTAETGLRMLASDNPSEKIDGFRNAIVFGRAVTNVIQRLRSKAEDFEAWYEPWKKRLSDDNVCRHAYKLRSEILKQGQLKTGASIQIGSLSGEQIQKAAQQTPPPGAKSFFICDSTGGSGWEVELPTGEIEKFYIPLSQTPGADVAIRVRLSDAPEPIAGLSIEEIGEHYVSVLDELVDDAWVHFGDKPQKAINGH